MGNNDKPVIFCLHGLGSTSLSFIEIAEELKEEYRFISVDAPGHGKTPPFERTEDYEMHNLANWLNEIINELRIEYFYFLSHSWGSFVALFYLLNYPEKYKEVFLLMVDIKQKGFEKKRWKKKLLIMKRTLMNTFLIIGTNFSKVKKKLILGGLHC